MISAELLGTQSGADKWQRLAPAAIIHFIVKFIVQFIKQGVQGLLPLGAVILTAGENRWFIISLVLVGVVILLLSGAVMSYFKFRFRLSGDTFLIQKGVFKRKRLSLTYGRIQNIAFKQPIYFRPFHLVVLGVESAGSSGEEVSLAGIPRSLAEEIRSVVFEKRTASPLNANEDAKENNDTDTQALAGDTEEILRQPPSELVRYGLSNNNIWVFAGITAGAIAQIDWDDWFFLADLKHGIETVASQSKLTAALMASGVFISIVLLLLAVSALGAVVTYYNYHLTRSDGRFHRTKGLFERQETSLPENKVQSLVIKQTWPARLLGRFHLTMRQVGFSRSNNGYPGAASNSKFLIPSVTDVFSVDFSAKLYPDFDWSRDQLKPIDRAFTRKIVLWIMLPIAAIPATALTIVFNPLGLLVLLVPFLLAPIIMLVRARYGYATDGKHGIVRSGFIGYKLTIFPFYKVQTVQLWQSPGQRERGLASLTIKLAGFTLEVPYIPLADAQSWRDQILYEIENHKGAWM